MTDYQRLKPRPGFHATYIKWDKAGRIREVQWERNGRERKAKAEKPAPDVSPRQRRGLMATERQQDLFGKP